MKPTVLHVVDTFLGRSEVFIYNVVTSHVDYQPSILCYASINETEFPFTPRVVLPAPMTKRDPAWWIDQTIEGITHRSLWHRRAEQVVRDQGPTVIHAHFAQQGYRMLPIKRRLGIPLVTNFYGYDMSVLPHRLGWRKKLDELFRYGDLFLVEGPHMRDRVIELGAPTDRICIQRISIFVDRYPRWQPETDPIVLFVGRFVEKKGLRQAIRAVREVRSSGLRLRFQIIGDGPERDDAERLVAAFGLSDCTQFLGMRAHGEVIQSLQRAQVLLHPSRTAKNGDSEGGAPTILLEAQAVGVPIVSTTHADIPHVVGSGRGIFLSAEDDAAQLAANLFAALAHVEGSDSTFVRKHHDVANEILHLERKYAGIARPTEL